MGDCPRNAYDVVVRFFVAFCVAVVVRSIYEVVRFLAIVNADCIRYRSSIQTEYCGRGNLSMRYIAGDDSAAALPELINEERVVEIARQVRLSVRQCRARLSNVHRLILNSNARLPPLGTRFAWACMPCTVGASSTWTSSPRICSRTTLVRSRSAISDYAPR